MKQLLSISQKLVFVLIFIYITSFNNASLGSNFGLAERVNIATESLIETKSNTIEGKVHISWEITGLTKDCLFFVQRSVNDGDYETINVTKGIGGEADLTVQYCYVDAEQPGGVVKYQVKRLDFAGPHEQGMANTE